ncbi:DNA-directed DNA polymerase delta [Clydaea vesicula]|uniref:DNA polymerase n=1 Tax=Clydaea vesicula TaxID=447962 RepID=A0AAD5U1F1_9FUNG|nr:DNA-directed DNA polymerase delta [Clydaea vesicula]
MIKLLDQGWIPIWTGYIKIANRHELDHDDSRSNLIYVRLAKDSMRIWSDIMVEYQIPESYGILVKNTAINPSSNVDILPSINSDIGRTRVAAVLGIAPFCIPGLGVSRPLSLPSVIKIIGLDIEQSTYYRRGAFPLPHDPLISIAIATWDGRFYCGYIPGKHDEDICAPSNNYKIIKFGNSTELADWAIMWIVKEMPDFVAIHNGFKYDISRLGVHCSSSFSKYFIELNLGKVDKGYDLIIPGITVIDTYWFLSKLHNTDYQTFALDALASSIGESGKLQHPTMQINVTDHNIDMTKMIQYNIHDAYLHIQVALKTRCLTEICTMCAVFKAPICDITRFISGTVVCSMASSYALSKSLVIDWSEDDLFNVRFRGGFVMTPITGLHKNVIVLDFASMYPSIIIGANISPETVHVVTDENVRLKIIRDYQLIRPQTEGDIALGWNSEFIFIRSSDVVFCIDRSEESISAQVMKELVSRRKSLPDKNSAEGWTLKIGANSIYGVYGASTSGLSSRLSAISVTGIGRYLIGKVMELATILKFEVLYGDTDSVFIKVGLGCKSNSDDLMDMYHQWASQTPFFTVRLEFDKSYSDIILIKPKIYFGREYGKDHSKPMMKGMASKRRDRPDISRTILKNVCNIICDNNIEIATRKISQLLYDTYKNVNRGLIKYDLCMKEMKREGIIIYSYRSVSGQHITLDKSKYDGGIPEPIDTIWLMNSIKSSISNVLSVCGIPTFDRLIDKIENLADDIEDII